MGSSKLEELDGIDFVCVEKLARAGIRDGQELVEACRDRAGRRQVTLQTGLPEASLLRWCNLADLLRIQGIGSEQVELLRTAGVDSVEELAARDGRQLAARLAEMNEAKQIPRRVPSESVVAYWISQAKYLPALISH